MQANPEKELDYFASYYILKSLYRDGIISAVLFDTINRANAHSMMVEPLIENSHIRQISVN